MEDFRTTRSEKMTNVLAFPTTTPHFAPDLTID
jgi:hypothetical protein